MANFIVTYDLNGPTPTHKQVDDLLAGLGAVRGRVLETVWWVGYNGTAQQLFDAVNTIFREEDQLMVCECEEAAWRNLLVNDAALVSAWNKSRAA